MEGKADLIHKKITNGELITYLKQNVTEEALLIIGSKANALWKSNKVLMSYRYETLTSISVHSSWF